MEYTAENTPQTRRNAPILAFNCKDIVFIIASTEWPQNAKDGVLSATVPMALHYADHFRYMPEMPLTFIHNYYGVVAVEHYWTATKEN